MAFEITCPGCAQTLLAEDAMQGKQIKCPSCQENIMVQPSVAAASPDAEDDEYQLADAIPLRNTAVATPTPGEDPAAQPPADEALKAKEGAECPACGVMIGVGQLECPGCRYNLQVGRRVEDFSGTEHYAGAVGFERFLLKRMHDSENVNSVFVMFHVAFAFVLGVVCLILLKWVIQIAVPAIALYLAYHLIAHSNGYFYRGKSFIGWMMLRTGRLIRWRTISGFNKRAAWTVHDPSFTDKRLAAKKDLMNYQAVDLQGTGVSDEGLKHLEYQLMIEFLVLKKTNVTEEGVARLQATIPDACIWY